jgi:N-acetylglutamate synthase-like GNAT family acetyltransferase
VPVGAVLIRGNVSSQQAVNGVPSSMPDVIQPCTDQDLDEILEVINDAAQAYKGMIPNDRFKDPYMPREELKDEIAHGVRFWGFEQDGELLGVMGLQDVEDVTLIRHAYVRTSHHRRGIGGRLLNELRPAIKGGGWPSEIVHRFPPASAANPVS